jgi:hypothetical protein
MVVPTGSAIENQNGTKAYTLPRATLLLCLRDNGQMGDMRYRGQGLSAESISREMR